MRNAYKILVGRPKWKRILRRHKHRWEYYDGSKGNRVVMCGLDTSDSEYVPVAGCHEHSN